MYDKSIVLDCGLYVPCVREGAVRWWLDPCLTLEEAQDALAAFPPDCGERENEVPWSVFCTIDNRGSRLERRRDKEDRFESLCVQAEACR